MKRLRPGEKQKYESTITSTITKIIKVIPNNALHKMNLQIRVVYSWFRIIPNLARSKSHILLYEIRFRPRLEFQRSIFTSSSRWSKSWRATYLPKLGSKRGVGIFREYVIFNLTTSHHCSHFHGLL